MADHKEYWSTESDQGSIRISEDVVASIAALSASETKGVSGLYSSLTSDIVGFISKKNLSKGVRIELGDDDTVKVEIGFLALFGYNICDGQRKCENVKSSIESMTGLRVVEINVHVGGVTFKPSAPAEEKAEPAPSETETPAETADAE
ncbi:MAG: Asp23/Gls24 family envelope stress response protein [Butyricicoccus sp.]